MSKGINNKLIVMAKILIIEDDLHILDIMKQILEDAGYEVVATHETEDLFNLISDFQPNLILMDFMLHGANGGELCYLIKKHSETAHLPVIIISAYTDMFISLGDYGYDALLSKPFDVNELVSTIQKFIPA